VIYYKGEVDENVITIEILVNAILISISLIVGGLAYYAWRRDESEFIAIINEIKNKPLHVIPRKNKET